MKAHVAVRNANGKLVKEKTFSEEPSAWDFAEVHLFRGKDVTVTLYGKQKTQSVNADTHPAQAA